MASAESRRITRKLWRERKFQEGFCRVCGKLPRDAGYTSCTSCREIHRKVLAKRFANSKSLGLCITCHKNPAEIDRVTCGVCNTKRSISAKKNRYNLSDEDYETLFREARCCICGNTENLHIDHCHTKGHVRGLLCIACNHGLGMFKDNVELLQTAIQYLEGASGI